MHPTRPFRHFFIHLVALYAACLFVAGCSEEKKKGYSATLKSEESTTQALFPHSFDTARLNKIGPDACIACHAEEVADWKQSHHAHANRLVSPELDRAAFTPRRQVKESGVTYELYQNADQFFLDVVEKDNSTTTYELHGVIGYTPVRQYLARLPGNKLQTISASYDVLEDKWFDVFAGDDRMPGEWGHWQGQGMNWNANCAYCHTTEYEKGFDFETNIYHSTWVQQGLTCAECHSGLEAHVDAAHKGNAKDSILKLTSIQTQENCATCHSRRDQLTPDDFEIGDDFHDHFGLSLPDQPGLYYPDGQIRDEVFVYGSFQISRMGHAGVSCIDCHNPHTLEPILPVENNMLCMRCHESGIDNAPIIQPLSHSFHSAGSTGNQCVKCHMPETVYMGNDWRADHGFHKPDPLLSQELGTPNACSSCHTDQTLDWAVEWSEKWYGAKLKDSRQRKRGRAIAKAYEFAPESLNAILSLAKDEDIPAWQATYIGLLGNFLPNKRAEKYIKSMVENKNPLIRNRAIGALSQTNAIDTITQLGLKDSSRDVRMTAARARASSNIKITDSRAASEWHAYQTFNSDRPQSLLLMANDAASQNKPADTQKYVERAVHLDAANPEIYRQAAVLLSSAGINHQAEAYLYKGWEIDPRNPSFPYSLGLLAAQNGDLDKAIGFLQETTSLEPQFYRAWYNLSLAYQKLNQPENAAHAMRRAQGNN